MQFLWRTNKRQTFFVFCLFRVFCSLMANPNVENSVEGEPKVTCETNSISVLIRTKNLYIGRIFVKGYSQDDQCQLMGSGERQENILSIDFDQCGVIRNREANGISISTTIVISFHPIFITKMDQVYRFTCFYIEKKQSVTQQLNIGSPIQNTIIKQNDIPICRYDILSNGPNGSAIKYAEIGELVYHKWSCDSAIKNAYCMRVHSCAVTDGQGGKPFYFLDEYGCETDNLVLQNLRYTDDLTAGQYVYVFKFADRPAVNFRCQVELSLKDETKTAGCEKWQPRCNRSNYDEVPTTEPYYISEAITFQYTTQKSVSNLYQNDANNKNTKPSTNNYGSSDNNIVNNYKSNVGNTGYDNSQSQNGQLQPKTVNPFRQYRLNFVKYEVINSSTSTTLFQQPSTIIPVISNYDNGIHANTYANNIKAPTYHFGRSKIGVNQISKSYVPDSNIMAFDASPQKAIKLTDAANVIPSQQSVLELTENFSFPPPIDVDKLYEDEVDAFVQHTTQVIDYNKDSSNNKKKVEKRNLSLRPRQVISDITLPEKSLVVIDIDEKLLAQNVFHPAETNKLLRGSRTFVPIVSEEERCISFSFFVTFSFIGAFISAIFSAILMFSLRQSEILKLTNALESIKSFCQRRISPNRTINQNF